MAELLANIAWHTLAGPHSKYSIGTGAARRYAPGFSPIVGFANPAQADFAGLARYCEPGEHFYCDGWTGAAPAGWRIETEATMFKMVLASRPTTRPMRSRSRRNTPRRRLNSRC
ncbi:MAG: hypothetical protein ABIO45_07850 [Burkholderiaceae bacterium]